MDNQKLIFVYNADSGKWNGYMDMAHKIFSPSTYPCSLCDLTYGIFKIEPAWEAFIQHSPVPFEFLHKDEFMAQYPHLKNTPLPIVLKQSENVVSELISQQELDSFKTIAALQNVILEKLNNW